MDKKFIIRNELEEDYDDVENLTREAFWNVYRPGCNEHLVIHNLWKEKCFIKELDYVIEKDNKIIANIVYAKSKITQNNGITKDILIFGPISVLQEKKKKGYGSYIIKYTMNKAKEMGYTEIAITGNPDYYHRFGFESASKYKIYYEGIDRKEESPFFMLNILDKSKFNIEPGVYSDPSVYKVDPKEPEEFEKKFPPKVKEKRPGQLE